MEKKCICNEPYDSERHEGGYPYCPVHDKQLDMAIIGHGSPDPNALTIADYEEVLEDHKRLVRELDVIINGVNAAKQASLCDIVSQMATEWPKRQGAVWVKASKYDISKGGMLFYRFDGPTLKSIGIGHFVGDLFHGVNLDAFAKWDWKYLYLLDESAPSGEREVGDDIKQVLAAFIKVARHIRNYPHPQLTIELLRSEAVLAEMKGERILGSDVYDQISELAFKHPTP